MATENDRGKGKEKEKESEAGPGPARRWFGRFQDGKWFCDCNMRAKCPTVKDKSSAHYGRQFWTCPRAIRDPDKCPFFLFLEDEERAKEWLSKYGPPPEPETPKANEKRPEGPPKSLETPWTLSKKRKPVSREASDEDENGGPANRDPDRDESPAFEVMDSPSKKVAKVTEVSTPGQAARDGVQNPADALPTPDTGSTARPPHRTCHPPRLEHAIHLSSERKSNLTSAVLRLLRSEGVELTSSIEIMIRHEIGTEMEVNEAKVRGYEETISELKRELDKMENMVALLGGDVGADDAVEFSD